MKLFLFIFQVVLVMNVYAAETHKILFIDKQEKEIVTLENNPDENLEIGNVLNIKRPRHKESSEDNLITVGKVKLIEVGENRATAEVIQNETSNSKSIFPKFSKIMAGDLAVLESVDIVPSTIISKNEVVSYFDLFSDPKQNPYTYELTQRGKDMLDLLSEEWQSHRMSRLLISGYTDAQGTREANEMESYQRALTIRQYLIQNHGYDPERVIAVGLGESELAEENVLPGQEKKNRRVEFKLLSQ